MTAASKVTEHSDDRAATSGPMLSDQDFKRIAAILFEDSGIHLSDGKASLVYSRLAKRLRALGLQSFRDYCALVTSADGAGERQAMLSALTTNVTRFFREPHHFTDLGERFRKQWMAPLRSGRKLRIWSAGCSSGEEPYSIAMTILAEMPDAAKFDIRILATDIDTVIVGKARKGEYPAQAAASIPPAMRNRMVDTVPGGGISIGADARSLVQFRELNLMTAWPMKGKFDVIFCRNVAIYFDDVTQETLWGRYASLLTPDGRLYVGHSERVSDSRFKADGLTAYRLAGAAA